MFHGLLYRLLNVSNLLRVMFMIFLFDAF